MRSPQHFELYVLELVALARQKERVEQVAKHLGEADRVEAQLVAAERYERERAERDGG